MTRVRRAAAVAVVLAVLGAASRARGDEPIEPPSPALLVTGLVLAAGGGTLAYWGARRYVDSDGTATGKLALSNLGTLTMQVGAGFEAYWAWGLGQHAFSYDQRGNLPLRSQRPRAFIALAAAAAAFATMWVGAGIVVAKEISCARDGAASVGDFQRCAKDATMTATLLDLAAGGVLLVAAPFGAYGFGYEAAARESGHSFVSLRLLPTPGGLALVGRF
jgi:hypothetical protein